MKITQVVNFVMRHLKHIYFIKKEFVQKDVILQLIMQLEQMKNIGVVFVMKKRKEMELIIA